MLIDDYYITTSGPRVWIREGETRRDSTTHNKKTPLKYIIRAYTRVRFF